MMKRINVDAYVRIPYKDHGRTLDGCDCFGLAMLVYRYEFGVELKDFLYQTAEDPKAIARLIDTSRPLIDAEEVEAPVEGDLVLMREGGVPSHIGVFCQPDLCLHTSRKYGTCCERVNGPRLKGKIVGYYRLKA